MDEIVLKTRAGSLTRNKLSSFLPTLELIKDFEALFLDVGQQIPAAINEAGDIAEAADEKATEALDAVAEAEAAAQAAFAAALYAKGMAVNAMTTAHDLAMIPNALPQLLSRIRALEDRLSALEQKP